MRRHWLIIVFAWSSASGAVAQIRLGKLTVRHKEVYEIRGTDIMVVDTLVLLDSARILLNTSKKDNFIHAKRIIAGKGSAIDGRGSRGIAGKNGVNGLSSGGPCRDGSDGQPGTPGNPGKDAVNLFLYVDDLRISGTLIIDLAGGDGGEGGKGGSGGSGDRGTRVCPGGTGGNGGKGAVGGNGGNGGNVTITSRYGTDLRSWVGEKIITRLYGGFAGQAGDGGPGGDRGLGPDKEGNQGKKGIAGLEGVAGKPGGIFFERK
jgi:hypothetical protein